MGATATDSSGPLRYGAANFETTRLPPITDDVNKHQCGSGEGTTAKHREYFCKTIPPEALDEGVIAAWRDLSDRALEPNPFLSPEFTLGTLRHLLPTIRVSLVCIYCREPRCETLVGLVILTRTAMSLNAPLRHIELLRGPHTFTNGILLDRDHAESACDALITILARDFLKWGYLAFSNIRLDGETALLLASRAATIGIQADIRRTKQRSILPLHAEARTGEVVNPHRRKELRRLRRRLEDLGIVTWHLIYEGHETLQEAGDTFLRLENMGWKHQDGSALLATPSSARFAKEVLTAFAAQGQLFFSELRLNGSAIASSCNFRSGNIGYAFKIGWDPQYSRYSPALLNEVLFMESDHEYLQTLSWIDSCAEEGSFIDEFWSGRQSFGSVVLARSTLSRGYLRLRKLTAKLIKHFQRA